MTTAKIPGPLRKMTFDEAKREAEGKVKLSQMRVFSEGDSTVSVMEIAKRILVEALKTFNGEIIVLCRHAMQKYVLDNRSFVWLFVQ